MTGRPEPVEFLRGRNPEAWSTVYKRDHRVAYQSTLLHSGHDGRCGRVVFSTANRWQGLPRVMYRGRWFEDCGWSFLVSVSQDRSKVLESTMLKRFHRANAAPREAGDFFEGRYPSTNRR